MKPVAILVEPSIQYENTFSPHVFPCDYSVSRDEIIAWLMKQPRDMKLISDKAGSAGKDEWFPSWIINAIRKARS